MYKTTIYVFHVHENLTSLSKFFEILNLLKIFFFHLFLLLSMKFDDFTLDEVVNKNFLKKYRFILEILKHCQILYAQHVKVFELLILLKSGSVFVCKFSIFHYVVVDDLSILVSKNFFGEKVIQEIFFQILMKSHS